MDSIGSFHGLDWIGLGRMSVNPCFFIYHFDINRLTVHCACLISNHIAAQILTLFLTNYDL